jgi:NADH dehydrogenase [ubiquinone] 1 alpha subcomplex assembly factor 7
VNALARALRRRILEAGPLTVAEFMQAALTDPEHGYYTKQDPFGVGGDFTTAPEISQMFGELIGLWCCVAWQAMDRPDPFSLVELGPGRGTLMADALRAAAAAPGFADAARLHLVEKSPALRARQADALEAFAPTWHEALETVPEGPVILVANEFFDALPVRQFVRAAGGWCERLVDAEPGPEADADAGFQFGLSPPLAEPSLVPEDLCDAPVGSVFEVSTQAARIMEAVARRVAGHGGAALVFDYGHAASAIGETLQAVRGHRFHDLLADPGDADLTAHVDFGALARAAEDAGARVLGPVPQGAFLERLGLAARADALLAHATPAQATDIRAAYQRLTDAQAMGTLFKALAVTRPGLAVPPWD